MPKIALRPLALILALLTGLSARAASAAEIKVVCSGAMRAVLQQLTPAFEKSSGDKLGKWNPHRPIGVGSGLRQLLLNLPRMSSSRRRPVWSAAAASPADRPRGARY